MTLSFLICESFVVVFKMLYKKIKNNSKTTTNLLTFFMPYTLFKKNIQIFPKTNSTFCKTDIYTVYLLQKNQVFIRYTEGGMKIQHDTETHRTVKFYGIIY